MQHGTQNLLCINYLAKWYYVLLTNFLGLLTTLLWARSARNNIKMRKYYKYGTELPILQQNL